MGLQELEQILGTGKHRDIFEYQIVSLAVAHGAQSDKDVKSALDSVSTGRGDVFGDFGVWW